MKYLLPLLYVDLVLVASYSYRCFYFLKTDFDRVSKTLFCTHELLGGLVVVVLKLWCNFMLVWISIEPTSMEEGRSVVETH